jgi:hypothetical protein
MVATPLLALPAAEPLSRLETGQVTSDSDSDSDSDSESSSNATTTLLLDDLRISAGAVAAGIPPPAAAVAAARFAFSAAITAAYLLAFAWRDETGAIGTVASVMGRVH